MLAAIAAAPGEAVNANTGTLLGLKGLVAALAVRFGPPLWAFAAGLVLGVVEAAIANVAPRAAGSSARRTARCCRSRSSCSSISLRPSAEALEEHE